MQILPVRLAKMEMIRLIRDIYKRWLRLCHLPPSLGIRSSSLTILHIFYHMQVI